MRDGIVNVVIAGLGGQGVLTASDVIAAAAFLAGLDVKKSEVHGMSQRGGSVASDIRFGARVLSPMVPPGEADFLVAFAPEWIDVSRPRLKSDGVLIEPAFLGDDAKSLGRALNTAMLGALSAHLDIDENVWIEAIRWVLPKKLHEMNERAFAIGRSMASSGNPKEFTQDSALSTQD
ncbi:indolepyruvate oxidoreductase subunit beta [bacterium]|nr:indolepyruvate oxidoreductase subunit beta [bacterium]